MKLILFSILLFSNICAQLVVVTNRYSDFNTLSKESIKYLYLGKVNKINNVKIKAYSSEEKVLHKSFVNNIIDKNMAQYNSYWARLVFTGRKPIPKRLSKMQIEEELTAINTIIYIKKSELKKQWKIVYEEK
jgi:hypothetical protein